MRKNNLSLADYQASCVKTPLDVTVTEQELFTQPL